MSETTSTPVAHEAYAFACMSCGYGWEQAYEIEHHTDIHGGEFVVYKANGNRVPSPLSRPTCLNCGGHVVRIMRSGQVSSVLDLMAAQSRRSTRAARHARNGTRTGTGAGATSAGSHPAAAAAAPIATAGPLGQEPARELPAEPVLPEGRQWHLSDLFHPFQRR
ncbi:hypothetical protein NX801_27435 [Streptomyces sp. LP05-1]|uniref:C2H2-type domain-containing protein n=1 Tax=Streptomyces pyxinae TaxID=2970734 RepID=A0ABT2CPE8_9ACTN|nr:hypothetical protein [Streptomyces sp. LP05-1]MCS0639305.1 hypothetical protein [Streptomyces sp. LP05-1]